MVALFTPWCTSSTANLTRLGFTHQDSLEKLGVKFTSNVANHTLIVHGDRAQVPILHDDIVVRNNL